MVSKYLMDLYNEDYELEYLRENPYRNFDLYSELATKKFKHPLNLGKWVSKIFEVMCDYRRKFALYEEYERKNSSLNKARDILEAAKNLELLFKDTRAWDYYYDSGDFYDVSHGLRTAISALNRMFAYAEPLKRVNLKKADPGLVLSYAKQWARKHTGFEEYLDDASQEEIIKFAKRWIEENRKSQKPNIKTAGPELIRDLAVVWAKAMKPTMGAVLAWDYCHQKQDTKTGKYQHGGEFFEFLWAVYEIFDELPLENSLVDDAEERVRLQRQALYQRIKDALVTKKGD